MADSEITVPVKRLPGNSDLPLPADVEIPVNLSEVYCGAFIRYQRTVSERKFAEMLAVEEKVRKSLNVDE